MNNNHLIKQIIGNLYLEGTFVHEETDFVKDAFTEISSINAELFELIPYEVIFTSEDVYKSAQHMREEVTKTNKIYIYNGWEGHPFLTLEQNLIGRAVHDVFAHMVCGCPFSFEGELSAFNEQKMYYPKWVWGVLGAEIVGQTCAYYANGKSHVFPQRAIDFPVEIMQMLDMVELPDFSGNSVLRPFFERGVS